MNKTTEIIVLLDRSGSMQSNKLDHIEGLNSLVAKQKLAEGNANFTLVQFDDVASCEVVYNQMPIQEVGDCPLNPRGRTPLFDAIGRAISLVDEKVKNASHVIFTIITDGLENASKEYTKSTVRSLIEEREKGKWTFNYLGANVDSFGEAGSLGISSGATSNYKVGKDAIRAMYSNYSDNVSNSRMAMNLSSMKSSMDFSDKQREEMNK